MLRLSLSYFVLMSACAFEPSGHPVDAPLGARDAPQMLDARAAAPVRPPITPTECSCTYVDSENYTMSLPFTRDETAAPGGQVKSALTNSIQDQIVANIGDTITANGGTASDDLNSVLTPRLTDVSALITELGGTPPTGLATLFAQGTFTPVLVDAPAAPFTYTRQFGWYMRIGAYVWTAIDIGWDNNQTSLDNFPMGVKPPYVIASAFRESVAGAVNTRRSQLSEYIQIVGGAAANATTVAVGGDTSSGALVIVGRDGNTESNTVTLAYGNDIVQRAVFTATYLTTGVFNY